MKRNRLLNKTLALTVILVTGLTLLAQNTKPNPPRVFILNAQKLAEAKKRIRSGDKSFEAALAKLESDARKALQQEPVSVVTKTPMPQSGDKHD